MYLPTFVKEVHKRAILYLGALLLSGHSLRFCSATARTKQVRGQANRAGPFVFLLEIERAGEMRSRSQISISNLRFRHSARCILLLDLGTKMDYSSCSACYEHRDAWVFYGAVNK